ncbi:MAG TPA: endolytic transglycosylase MltG [Azospira sp.]|nr:endolytic transglycosylase MltG [Azospira sp.]HNN45709.1 endolytic transglycosylase MltG [Azospira sp.]
MLRFLRRLFLLALLLLGILAAGSWWVVNSPVGLRTSPLDFTVAPGSSLRMAAQQVTDAGVSLPPIVLAALGRILGVDAQIKAGSYEIRAGITPLELLRKLTRGDVTQAEILFVEGWTFRQLREKLDAHPDVRHELRGLPEAELMKRIGANEALAEGLFFPDTYLFAKNSSDTEIMARAYRAMKRHIDREWQQRASNLPYRTPYEALVMASIVEKETGRAADRPMIASVFVNRLRVNMLLQTDPTVIYGLGDRFDGNLRKRDLLADTPYNTYTRPGLPPGPIASPGLASLRAALNPASSDALYFVARGDGTSQFSRTLEEHNQAVVRYQLKGGKR